MITVRHLYNHLRSPTFSGLTRKGSSGHSRQDRRNGRIVRGVSFRWRAKLRARRK